MADRLPDTGREWMRRVERRLRRLERHRHNTPSGGAGFAASTSGWTITTDDAGNLVARHDSGAPDVIVAPAP